MALPDHVSPALDSPRQRVLQAHQYVILVAADATGKLVLSPAGRRISSASDTVGIDRIRGNERADQSNPLLDQINRSPVEFQQIPTA